MDFLFFELVFQMLAASIAASLFISLVYHAVISTRYTVLGYIGLSSTAAIASVIGAGLLGDYLRLGSDLIDVLLPIIIPAVVGSIILWESLISKKIFPSIRVFTSNKISDVANYKAPIVLAFMLVPLIGIWVVFEDIKDSRRQQQREILLLREETETAKLAAEAARLAAETARREAEQARSDAAARATQVTPEYPGGFRPGDQVYICMSSGNSHSATVVSNSGGDRIELRPDRTFTIGLINTQTYYASNNYYLDRSAIAGDRATCQRWAN